MSQPSLDVVREMLLREHQNIKRHIDESTAQFERYCHFTPIGFLEMLDYHICDSIERFNDTIIWTLDTLNDGVTLYVDGKLNKLYNKFAKRIVRYYTCVVSFTTIKGCKNNLKHLDKIIDKIEKRNNELSEVVSYNVTI